MDSCGDGAFCLILIMVLETNLKATQVRDASPVSIYTWKGQIAKKPCSEEASQNWTSSENWGGEAPKKRQKSKTFSKRKCHLGSRYLISISSELFYPKIFLCFGVGAAAYFAEFLSDEMERFGSFWSYLSLIVPHVFRLVFV